MGQEGPRIYAQVAKQENGRADRSRSPHGTRRIAPTQRDGVEVDSSDSEGEEDSTMDWDGTEDLFADTHEQMVNTLERANNK